MKTKKNLKRVAAVLLSAVLLVTSLPMVFSATADSYNPAPYFSEEAQQNGAAAWLDQEGDLQVRFPSATGRPTHAVWSLNHNETANVKTISKYVIELSDLGGKLEAHNTNPTVLLTKTIPAKTVEENEKLSAVFSAAEIESLGEEFDIVNKRYNVAITAVDNEGWRSLSLNAMVFDVPEYYFDMDKFEILSESETAVREMMRFEKTNKNYTGYEQTGDNVDRLGIVDYTGAIDPETNLYSKGYRLRITGTGAQTFDTPESRQTWDFAGAEEVWYWLDLSEVELKGVSFRLRANDKKVDYNSYKGTTHKTTQRYSSIVYSTLGTKFNTYAADEAPYILLQNENGNWEKVMINNGTVDIGHFKGYVRIPVKYFCSETATQVNATNAWYGQKFSFGTNAERDKKVAEEVYMISYDGWNWNGTALKPDHASTTVEVDPAGTPISEALLIQEGYLIGDGPDQNEIKIFGSVVQKEQRDKYEYELGHILAPGVTDSDIALADNPRRSTMVNDGAGNWSVQRAENPYTALEDLYSAGIAYQSVGEGSTNQSIFLDDIMFYRTDGQKWAKAELDGFEGKTEGAAVDIYYDQATSAQDRILYAIDEYIGSPTWTDYRGVKYVDDMIAAFKGAYQTALSNGETTKNPDDFFTDAKLQERASATGKAQTWSNYITAKKLCGDEKLLDGNNSRPNDLVPMIVQKLEQLPDPSQVTSISDALYEEIIKIYQAYTRLNYGQLKMLGNYVATDATGNPKALYEEEKILRYAQILLDQLENNTVTGYKMANYPFIPFNDFEQNTEIGDKAWRLEDDPNFASSSDYRQIKNFSTLATNDKKVVDDKDHIINQSYSEAHDYAHTGDTRVTKDGYANTKGLTTTFESAALQGNAEGGVFYAMYFNKDSKTDAADTTAYKANNMSALNLGQLAKNNNSALVEEAKNPDGSIYLPFSLIMYVDFSELTDESGAGDFIFGIKIHTLNSSGEEICYRPAMGSQIGGNKYWRSYFILDQDPNSANFGEWKRVFVQDRGWAKGNYMFPSKTTNPDAGEEPASLAGYKGYIAIPMNHFKRGGTDGDFLVEKSTELNNIYSITFGITNVNGTAMYDKSITIDNVGFTYDPDYYKDSLSVDLSGRNDKSYAEAFGAKSSKATDFEKAVAAIDPYDETTRDEKISFANEIYNQLADYQKTHVQTVIQAKALLDKYIARDIPDAVMTVDELKTAIANLPNIPENAVTANPLPNPGFIVNNSNPLEAGEVNYEAFGFASQTQALDIAKYYTDTYKRLSSGDKAQLTEAKRTKLINAYNAAMRCTGTLETIKDKGTEFSDHLKTVYTRYTDGTKTLNLISVSKRNEVAQLSAIEYEPLPYYAKLGLDDGSLIPAFANMTDGISRFFANVITDESGNITDGGVKVLMEKYTKLYIKVREKLDAKDIIPDDLANELNDAIAEYNDLIPAYKNVFELYYGSEQGDPDREQSDPNQYKEQYKGIKDIVELFMQTDVSFEGGATEATLALNPDNESTASQTLNVNYIEELPVDKNGNTTTYFTIKYNGTLTGGVDTRKYELSLNGNPVSAVDLAADPIIVTDDLLGAPIKNNSYTEANPYEMVFTARLIDKELFAQQLTDTVTICHYRPADPEKGETADECLGTYTLNVTYTPQEAFTVMIPAEVPVDWGDTKAIDVSYSVDCVLGSDKKIEVSVAGNNILTAQANSAYTMNYTAEGFNLKTPFKGVHTNSKPATLPTIKIADEMWKNKPIGEYRDTLTYTVEYTKN